MGYIPVSAKETGAKSATSVDDFLLRFQRVKFDDLIFFTRQLRTVVRSGIPIVAGLRALAEQTTNQRLRKAIGVVAQDIDKGFSFSDALARHKGIFSEIYVSMVRSGETSGSLEEVLERLSALLEFQMKTKETIKSAMRYPILRGQHAGRGVHHPGQCCVPKFAPLFRSAKIALPAPPRYYSLSMTSFRSIWGSHLSFSAALVVGFFLYKRRITGDIPLMSSSSDPSYWGIILKTSMSRFAFTLENLVSSGVPIMRTLDIVSRTVGNEFVAKKVLEISANIERGRAYPGP
jgi:type IV pilus assembly protein PilC